MNDTMVNNQTENNRNDNAGTRKVTARGVLLIVAIVVVMLVMLAAAELNKNRMIALLLIVVLAFAFHRLYMEKLANGRKLYKFLGWIGWIAAFFAVILITWPPVQAVPAVTYKNPVMTEVVTVTQGDLQGVVSEDGQVEIYTGIPYAKPPVGDLRWKEPQDPDAWDGVLVCDHYAPMSMQPVNLPIYNSLVKIIGFHDYKWFSKNDRYRAPVSEDSLYLNIWKPAGEVSNLPVLVYVHGGSLKTGQPWYDDYSGQGLARDGVVVVNMGYRLGAFGFFADEELAAESPVGTTGNYGLMDQIKALEWVQKNIAAFGGDPGNVTLAGESAGASSVSALCTSPIAAGLFNRVMLESSTVAPVEPTHSFRPFDEALESGAELKSRYGCTTVAELRNIDAKKLAGEAETQHHITVDGYVLSETPYESYSSGMHNEHAIMHGYNAKESGSFILFDKVDAGNFEERVREYFEEYSDEVLAAYPHSTDEEAAASWAEIYGAVFFDYPHYCLNRLAVQNGIPVFEYYFSKDNGRLGAWHSGEEVYFYGNIPDDSKLYDDYDRTLSQMMKNYYLNFIKTGDPNGEGLPAWEQNLVSAYLMEFGTNTGMMEEGKRALFKALDDMQGW